MQEEKNIKFSTFIITIISLIIVFIILLLCIVLYYEHKLDNQITDLTFITDSTDDDTEENLKIVE